MTLVKDLPLTPRHFRLMAVSSMEQLIGAGISTLAGVIIPMLKLLHPGEMSSLTQGLMGSASLMGIAVGAPLIGRLSDRSGYLFYFRLCPLLITAGALLGWLCDAVVPAILGLFVMGLGVGGGYSLDTDYLSELMPERWRLTMVGMGKAMPAPGFFMVAGLCWLLLERIPEATMWRWLMLIVAALGALTFVMRLRWWGSPKWLVVHGEGERARRAARRFFGADVEVADAPVQTAARTPFAEMFRGENLKKVIFTGIPWACEGVGVYGVGVFLPILLMSLGIDRSHAEGMDAVVNSVRLTTLINFFIIAGFVIGLFLVRRVWHPRMLAVGFWVSAASLAVLAAAYICGLPAWVSVAAFVVFEMALNAGPHIVTFVLPAEIYPVESLGTGTGIASMLGKVGAILGVLLLPVILHAGGVIAVLLSVTGTLVVGAVVASWLGRQVLPEK